MKMHFGDPDMRMRQLTPDGLAFQNGDAEIMGAPKNWAVALGLVPGAELLLLL